MTRLKSPKRTIRKDENDTFGYQPPPEVPALDRAVYKWVHSLGLSHSIQNVRRDVANGYVIAEILSRYFPGDIMISSFQNSASMQYRRDNWEQLTRICRKHDVPLPDKLVEATLQGAHGSANTLLEGLYEKFTGKKLQRLVMSDAMDGMSGLLNGTGMGAAGADVQDAGGPKPVSKVPAELKTVEFGAVQTRLLGDGMAIRSQFANK